METGSGPASPFRLSAVIEIMRFRLPPGADEAAFLAADRRIQEEFIYQQSGLLRRTTARGEDDGWLVMVHWRSSSDADAAEAQGERNELARAFWALLDSSSISVERFQELD
jgi:hypothetical protein